MFVIYFRSRPYSYQGSQRSEIRGQRAEDRARRAEGRWRRAEDGRQTVLSDLRIPNLRVWNYKAGNIKSADGVEQMFEEIERNINEDQMVS